MRTCRQLLIVQVMILASITAATLARASQDVASGVPTSIFPLQGRHALSLHVGVSSRLDVGNSVDGGSVSSDIRASGALAAFSYAYWVSPEWSVGLGASLIDAESDVSIGTDTVTSKSAAVTSVLVGAAYYPTWLAISSSLRPYASAGVGPFLGSASNSRVGLGVDHESVADAAFGLRLLAGADLFFARRFKAGIALGYDFVADFDVPIGSCTNCSGLEFSAGFGALFGSGR